MELLPSGTPDHNVKGQEILALARGTIGERLGKGMAPCPDPAWLSEPGASFVTLTIDDELRGCIGSLTPVRSFGEDVRYNALLAAFRDPRFPPLDLREFDAVRIGVSLISPMEPVTFLDLLDLSRTIRPGEGLLLRFREHSATYLPEVWEMLPDPLEFLSELLKKGGIPRGAPPEELRAYSYTTTVWKED